MSAKPEKTKEGYQEFLRSEFWLVLSMAVKRKVGKCERCGFTKTLECHHKFYRDDWHATLPGDLEVLCDRCHKIEHRIIKGHIEYHYPKKDIQLRKGEKVIVIPVCPKCGYRLKRKNPTRPCKNCIYVARKRSSP